MDLKEELINYYRKTDSLCESIYKVIDPYGRELDVLHSQEEIDAYNDKNEDRFEYNIVDVPEEPIITPEETKKVKDSKPSQEVLAEIKQFFDKYNQFKAFYEKRIEIAQSEEPSEYGEMVNDKKRILHSFWNREIKSLSKEAQTTIKKWIKIRREAKNKLKESFIGDYHYNQPLLNEDQKSDFTFYKTLLEATFNPNVKSSWITQIWFEPNDDELEETEDEEGNIIPVNPHNPNLKGTVFMRVKNSKTGKVYPTYEFYNVPRKVYIMWRRARSKGKYFWRRMKYNYEG